MMDASFIVLSAQGDPTSLRIWSGTPYNSRWSPHRQSRQIDQAQRRRRGRLGTLAPARQYRWLVLNQVTHNMSPDGYSYYGYHRNGYGQKPE